MNDKIPDNVLIIELCYSIDLALLDAFKDRRIDDIKFLFEMRKFYTEKLEVYP